MMGLKHCLNKVMSSMGQACMNGNQTDFNILNE